uniref:Junctophilin-3 n=1 Tax=Schistocephalus solidus TaxID=70667 RepID=A0A0X3NXT2_SCHSO
MAGAEGGRFDFDDGGSYVGEWCEGRAHGLGIATGPDNQGEYSGEWIMGFESRGVYVWPSGNIYAGGWLKGKRHGEGVQVKGRWIYRGAFTAGFCGRYGIKESLTTCARYEGSWHLNQFDGFGVETNSDGSTYAGGWSKGMRQGLGVRKSAPYGLASENNRAVRASQSQSSLPSAQDSERGWRGVGSSGSGNGDQPDRSRSELAIRSGFVLRSSSQPIGGSPPRGMRDFRSPSPSDKKTSFRKFLMRKLRKPKSTGDLSSVGPHTVGGLSATGTPSLGRFHLGIPRPGGSLRSNISGGSQLTSNSVLDHQSRYFAASGGTPIVDTLDEPLTPNVTETYSGQWNEDRRSGYGVAERSDGLRYEGEWFNNKKDGFGVTYHPDGTKEEGRYKENILVQSLSKRNKLYLLRHSKLKESLEEAVRKANEAAKEAQEKSAEVAHQRAQSARSVATSSEGKAEEARRLSEQARTIAREFASDFIQMGIQWEKENPYSHMVTRNATNVVSKTDGQLTAVAPGSSSGLGTATATKITANSLEVSGGSKRGSFRSSFKRSNSPNSAETKNQTAAPRPQHLSPNTANKTEGKVSNSRQYATVQQVEDTHPEFETIDMPAEAKVTRTNFAKATLHSAQIVQGTGPKVHKASLETRSIPVPQKATSSTLTTPSKPGERVAQGRPMARAATAGLSGPPVNPTSVGSTNAFESPTRTRRARRRTLPSIMTASPLLQPSNATRSSREASIPQARFTSSPKTAMLTGRPGDKRSTLPSRGASLETTHSTENLAEEELERYIIEDGIRKRVQPTRSPQRQLNPGTVVTGYRHPRAGTLERRDLGPTRLHDLDETRQGSFTGRRLGNGFPEVSQVDYDSRDVADMPDAYIIEPVPNAATCVDTSMPDVSKHLVDGLGGIGGTRLGISGLLTRDEVSRLSQQRRQEILLEMERKKRGEIIIRLADIKDWVRANFVVVIVLLINACLAFLFINLVNNAGSSGPSSSRPTVLTPEEKIVAANAAEEAVRKALRAANAAALKSRDAS